MNKEKKLFRFKSQKVNRMLDLALYWWFVAVVVFIFIRYSNSFTTDKPSEISLMLKEYNPLLACLPIAFTIILALKLTEFFLIRLKSGEMIPKDKSVLEWLIEHFQISYKADQLVLKDETILLIWQFMFCVFGFFIELKWYPTGALGIAFYLCIYIALSFRDIKKFLKNLLADAS